MTEKDLARFFRKVVIDDETGCWMFILGCQDSDGYGQFWLGKRVQAHRASFEHFNGPIPEGLELDHKKCQRRCCANPAHLEPVTHLENLKRKGWYRMAHPKPAKRARAAIPV